MFIHPFIDELVKKAAQGPVSDEQARRALDELESIDRNKPTAGQLARYTALGAVAGPAVKGIGRVIAGNPPGVPSAGFMRDAIGGGPRTLAAEAVGGALTTGAIPLIRQHLDRRAQHNTLKQYMAQPAPEEKLATAFRQQLELMKLARIGPPGLVTAPMGKLFGQVGQTLKPQGIAQNLVGSLGRPTAGSGGLLAGAKPVARPAGVPTPKMVPGGAPAGPPRPPPGAPPRPVGQVLPPPTGQTARPMAGTQASAGRVLSPAERSAAPGGLFAPTGPTPTAVPGARAFSDQEMVAGRQPAGRELPPISL